MRTVGLSILCLTLLACAGDPPRAPVEARRGVQKAVTQTGHYRVVRGDTLYAIAWRYGLDYRELARMNGIATPYTIYPGQTLSIRRGRGAHTGTVPSAGSAAGDPAAGDRETPVVTTSSSRRAATMPAPDTPTVITSWNWPTTGKVVREFSGTVHKGIDIAGDAGDPVRSTAAGRVVYAGSGIVGYGQLVIVKHSEAYLSAYGHNRRLLVAEGEPVAQGQEIAEKGSSGTNTVKLHFEIRREGKPVNPLTLLDKRAAGK